MTDATSQSDQADKIRLAKRVVSALGCFVTVSLLVSVVFGAYYCSTERPAREMFYPPEEGERPAAGE